MEPLELENYLAWYFNGPPSQKTCFKTSLDHLKTIKKHVLLLKQSNLLIF